MECVVCEACCEIDLSCAGGGRNNGALEIMFSRYGVEGALERSLLGGIGEVDGDVIFDERARSVPAGTRFLTQLRSNRDFGLAADDALRRGDKFLGDAVNLGGGQRFFLASSEKCGDGDKDEKKKDGAGEASAHTAPKRGKEFLMSEKRLLTERPKPRSGHKKATPLSSPRARCLAEYRSPS